MTSFPFSVVINTYNRASSLPATLDGLTRQIDKNFEVVVVNGPSTDGSSELLEGWSDRVRVINFDEVHLGKSRNLGIRAAAGEVVAFIDDDAVPEPDWVSGLRAGFEDKRVAGAGGLVWDHTGVELQYRYSACSRIGDPRFDLVGPFDEYMYPGADPFMYLQGTNCSFRRDALVEIGGFDETIEYYLDEVEVCLQLIDRGHRLAVIDGAAVHHHYLPSHLRADRTTWTHPFPIVKNRYYFALSHGCAERSQGEVLLELDTWAKGVVAGGRRELTRIGQPERIDSYIEQVHRGISEGVTLGLAASRKSVDIGDPEGEFRPFPTVAGEHTRRYCFVSGEYPPDVGGVGRFTSDTARGLAAEGHEVHVVTRTDTAHRIDVERGVWVHRVPIQDRYIPELENSPLRFNLEHCTALYHEVDRLHRRRPVDLVSAPIWNCEGLLPSLDQRFPTVTTLVTTIEKVLEILPSWQGIEHIRALAALEVETLRRAPFVHANSTATERSALTRTDGTVHLAHFGLDDPSLGVVAATRAEEGTVEVLFVGRLERRKGIDLLLEILPDLLDRWPELRVRIIGRDTPSTEMDATYREAFLLQHADSPSVLRRVEFAGELTDDEVRSAYAGCDIFCAPSRYESFGLVLLEAMSFSKPVVACDEGGMSDLVEDNGILVPIDDSAALSVALSELIGDADKREQMGRRGRELFEQTWQLDHAVERTDELYGLLADSWTPTGSGIVPNDLAEVLIAAGALNESDALAAAVTLLAPDRSPADLIGGVVRLLLCSDAHFIHQVYLLSYGRKPFDWELEVQMAHLGRGGSPLTILRGLGEPGVGGTLIGAGWEAELVPLWSRAVRQQVVAALAASENQAFLEQSFHAILRRGVGPDLDDLLAQLAEGRTREHLIRQLALSDEAAAKEIPIDWLDELAPTSASSPSDPRSDQGSSHPARRARRAAGSLRRVATEVSSQASREHELAQRLDRIEAQLLLIAQSNSERAEAEPAQADAARPDKQAQFVDSLAVQRLVAARIDELVQQQHSGFEMVSSRVDELTKQQHSGFDNLTTWLDVLSRKQEAMAMDLRERLPAGPPLESLPEPKILTEGGLEALRERDGGVLRANLGAGEKPLKGYVNTDARALPEIDVVADVRKLPFEEGSLEELCSQHLVEHFRFHEFRTVILPYWKKLLASSGQLRVVCPDLSALVNSAATENLSMDQLAVAIFGLQDYSGDDHLAMYTPESLTEMLLEAGFAEVEVAAAGRRNGGTYEMELLAWPATRAEKPKRTQTAKTKISGEKK
ncbi:unannotated protein [freshwater metagenome]|uniref:Unannotated protein n=1 Tax=freshwater metagenome TaxID=449393 RepID=A0A6J7HC49_9ZZZZ|nr:glycosyltransferase [Actinomycetota bacterium]